MKITKILYWVFTILFALAMLASGIPDVLSVKEAVDIFAKLQLPAYLLPFLGIAKVLGAIAIVIPGFNRLKEWAYAGLFYDLLGAAWCNYSAHQPGVAMMLIPIAIGTASYVFFRKKQQAGM